MKQFAKKAVILLILHSFALPLFSGSSFFGFGANLLGSYQYPYSTAALGRGGFAMAVVDTMSLNQINFATWAKMRYTTFGLNMEYNNLNIQSANNNIFLSDGNFKGGYIAWPVIPKKLTMGIGLAPYAESDLGIELRDVGVGSPATQSVESSGTLSEAKVIFSYTVTERLALSVVPYFNFGVITDVIRIHYDDIAYGNIIIENSYRINGFGVEASAYYQPWQWIAGGARFKMPAKLNVTTEQKSQSAEKTIEEVRDLKLPLAITLGMVLRFSDRFLIGADLDFQNWKDGYEVDYRRISNMQNSFRFGTGLERSGSTDRFASYFQKMSLRAGAFYGQLNATSNGETVHEYGISFGLGLPIAVNRNRFDLSAEFGRRGDKSINYVEELFFRLNLSLSTNELWFIQTDR